MTYSARFLRCDALTAELEGGLANNAADRGGETAFGISRRSYPTEEPWPPSRERAQAIRHLDYWQRSHCDELPELIALAVYDWTIHSGRGAPARALQNILGVKVDGDIGLEITVPACLARCSTPERELELAEALMRARARLLAEIVRSDSSQAEFLGGWLARMLAVGAAIRDAYLIALESRPIEPLEVRPMTAPVTGGETAPREASSPLQGIVRQVVRVPIAMLLGWIAASLPSLVSADAVPGLTDTVTLSVSGVILAALAGLGKLARDRGWPVLGSLL